MMATGIFCGATALNESIRTGVSKYVQSHFPRIHLIAETAITQTQERLVEHVFKALLERLQISANDKKAIALLTFIIALEYYSNNNYGRWEELVLSGSYPSMQRYWHYFQYTRRGTIHKVVGTSACALRVGMALKTGDLNLGQLLSTGMYLYYCLDIQNVIHEIRRHRPTAHLFDIMRFRFASVVLMNENTHFPPVNKPDVYATGMLKHLKAKCPDRPSVSHPVSSQIRNNFYSAVKEFATAHNVDPYVLGMSRRCDELGFKGIRRSNLPGLFELNAPELYISYNDPVPSNPVLVMVDRDYFYDMNKVLSHGHVVLLYTFSPEVAGQVSNEVSFCFEDGGYISGVTPGSTPWKHFLWNYPDDIFRIGDGEIVWAYKSYRYRVSQHRFVILLVPINFTYSGEVYELSYYKPIFGSTVIVHNNVGSRKMVSVGTLGSRCSNSIPLEIWDDVVGNVRSRSTETKITPITSANIVDRLMQLHKFDRVEAGKAAVWMYPAILGLKGDYAPHCIHPFYKTLTTTGTFELLKDNENDSPDGLKPLMISVVEPYINNASVAPAKSSENNKTAEMNERIIKPQINAAKMIDEVTGQDLIYGHELVGHLLPKGTVLIPVDEAEVNFRMGRKAQVADRIESEACTGNPPPKTNFTKPEAYVKVTRPRPITQMKGDPLKWKYARYIYSLATHLKTQPTYAAGMSPETVSQRVSDICVMAAERGWGVAKTDYTGFDGTVNAFCRWFIKVMIEAAFPGTDASELADEQYFREVCTLIGMIFTAFALGSGMQDTSLIGFLMNLYNAYCYLREVGLSPEKAFDSLGIYQGDDGLTLVPSQPELYERIVYRHGQVLEVEVANPDNGVRIQFLSRYYSPLVWFGSTESCCDIYRQHSKITFTSAANKNVPLFAHWCKTEGYLITDPNTPIISEYCNMIRRLCLPLNYKFPDVVKSEQRFDDIPFHAQESIRLGARFNNENTNGWMHDLARELQPEFDLNAHRTWCAEAKVVKNGIRDLYTQSVLEFLNAHPTFDLSQLPKHNTGGDAVRCTLHVDGDVHLINGVKTMVPDKLEKLPKNNNEKEFQIWSEMITDPPRGWEAGSLKCFYVFAREYGKICQVRPAPWVLYTGARGLTSYDIAHAFSHLKTRVDFVDPGWTEEEVKYLNKYVTVRKTKMNNAFMKDYFQAAHKANARVIWLDDAFTMQQENARHVFNDMKMRYLRQYQDLILHASIKVMQDNGSKISYPEWNDKVDYYETPVDPPFEFVTEMRLSVTPSGITAWKTMSTAEIRVSRVNTREACLIIDKVLRNIDAADPVLKKVRKHDTTPKEPAQAQALVKEKGSTKTTTSPTPRSEPEAAGKPPVVSQATEPVLSPPTVDMVAALATVVPLVPQQPELD
jgi:hypothetical protein